MSIYRHANRPDGSPMRRDFYRQVLCCIGIVLLAVMVLASCSDASRSRRSLRALGRVPMPSFDPPQVWETTLANGAVLFVFEDRELPIINVSVIARAGSIFDPADKIGTSRLAAMLLEDGGTRELSPDEVDAVIDDTAARISVSASREMITASLKTLSSESERILPVFIDLLLRPRLDSSRLEINRLKLIDAIRREDDDPDMLAAKSFRKLIYGPDSPWARTPTPDDIAAIDRDDIADFSGRFMRPVNMIIAASGDLNAHRFAQEIERLSAGVPNESVQFPAVKEIRPDFHARQQHIERPINQAFIYMGHLGIRRHNPDKYALQIMNAILGGASFKSRLLEDIRTTKGLAYSVWSQFGWGTDYGIFSIYAATKAATASDVIGHIRRDVEQLAKTGFVTREEIGFAKDVVLNGLIFEFDDPFKIAFAQAEYRFYGYPPNYWEIYRDNVRNISRRDVRRVAKKYLHPAGLSTLVVGPAAQDIP